VPEYDKPLPLPPPPPPPTLELDGDGDVDGSKKEERSVREEEAEEEKEAVRSGSVTTQTAKMSVGAAEEDSDTLRGSRLVAASDIEHGYEGGYGYGGEKRADVSDGSWLGETGAFDVEESGMEMNGEQHFCLELTLCFVFLSFSGKWREYCCFVFLSL
jgi:hypothetical protein